MTRELWISKDDNKCSLVNHEQNYETNRQTSVLFFIPDLFAGKQIHWETLNSYLYSYELPWSKMDFWYVRSKFSRQDSRRSSFCVGLFEIFNSNNFEFFLSIWSKRNLYFNEIGVLSKIWGVHYRGFSFSNKFQRPLVLNWCRRSNPEEVIKSAANSSF